jgi:hypothetical protein
LGDLTVSAPYSLGIVKISTAGYEGRERARGPNVAGTTSLNASEASVKFTERLYQLDVQ